MSSHVALCLCVSWHEEELRMTAVHKRASPYQLVTFTLVQCLMLASEPLGTSLMPALQLCLYAAGLFVIHCVSLVIITMPRCCFFTSKSTPALY